MSRRTFAVALVLVLLAGGALLTLGVAERPTVTSTESRFESVNASATVVETDLRIRNSNPVGVSLDGATVNHTVVMNDLVMGTGTKEGVAIGEGTTTATLTTVIDNRKISAWWKRHIENGERTRVETTARVRTPLLGRLRTVETNSTVETDITGRLSSNEPHPVDADLPLVSDPLFVVERTTATWGTVTTETTPLATELVIANPHSIALPIVRIDYTIWMNGVAVGNGTTGQGHLIPAEGRRTVDARATIDNERLDEWWVSHLRHNQRTDLRVAFTAVLELPDGETVRVTLDGLGYHTEFETDILGSKRASER